MLKRYTISQAKEIARICVEPPLQKKKPNEAPFKPSISLEKTVNSLIDCIKRFPNEKCQFCKKNCLPENPEVSTNKVNFESNTELNFHLQNIETNESAANHVERLYCGHLFHNHCLVSYMRKPPFGNKRCVKCNKKIYHDKWGLTDRLAEDRWAHEQARERELAEVTDFFQ